MIFSVSAHLDGPELLESFAGAVVISAPRETLGPALVKKGETVEGLDRRWMLAAAILEVGLERLGEKRLGLGVLATTTIKVAEQPQALRNPRDRKIRDAAANVD